MDELNFTNLLNIKLHEVFGLFASEVPGSVFKLGCLVASEPLIRTAELTVTTVGNC